MQIVRIGLDLAKYLSGGVPFSAGETDGDRVELSIIGNLEFDDFLKSVAALRQKRAQAAA